MPASGGTRGVVAKAHARLLELVEQYRADGRDRLPTEAALSSELGVSRNSLREALTRLEGDGVIVRRRRVGTLIVPVQEGGSPEEALEYPIDAIVSIPDFFAAAGQPFDIEWVSVAQERADPATAGRLGLAVGEEIYRVRRKYVLRSGPAAIGEHAIPRVLRGHGVHIEALTDGVSTFLADVEDINVDVVEHVVDAIAADAILAEQLDVLPGAPLLAVDASLQSHEGAETHTVAVGRLTFRPGRVRVRAAGRGRASA